MFLFSFLEIHDIERNINEDKITPVVNAFLNERIVEMLI
jgi:hypothetical protein